MFNIFFDFRSILTSAFCLCFSVCCHTPAGICNRVRGGGARLHIQSKGKHCFAGRVLFC